MPIQTPVVVPKDDSDIDEAGAAPLAFNVAPNAGGKDAALENTPQVESSAEAAPNQRKLGLKEKQRLMGELYHAAKRGDVSAVLALLDSGADANWRLLAQWRAIDVAAAGGHAPLVEALLQAGASTAHEHHSPLYLACASSDERSVRALLSAGAVASASAGVRGRTALHRAAASPDGADEEGELVPSAVLQTLLRHLPPDAAAVSCAAGTPLHLALRLGRLGNAAWLIKTCPKHAMLSANGSSTLDVALSTGSPRALALVVQAAPMPMGGAASLTQLAQLRDAPRDSPQSAMLWMLLCRVVRDAGRACSSATVRLLRAALAGRSRRMDALVAAGADPSVLQAPSVVALVCQAAAAPQHTSARFSLDAWLLERGLGGALPVPSSPLWQEVDDTDLDSD